MKRLLFLLLLCNVVSMGRVDAQTTEDYWRSVADSLVARMTLDEKLSMLTHHNPAIERLGLTSYSWWNEALHGVGRAGLATVFPMPIALAATYDTALIRQLFQAVALEAQAKYHEALDREYHGDYAGITFFTPNINLFRDPRWGRGMETYGEDPMLTASMGRACVEGLQQEGAAACLKHFAVHSGPESIRHQFDSRVTRRDLRMTYLAAFEYIIKHCKVWQVMCAYNRLNGAPCCTDRRLLDEILRGEWHYDGMVVTDCWALNDTYEHDTVVPRHEIYSSAEQAYGAAFGGAVDLECGSGQAALHEAVLHKRITERQVDIHVRRVLSTRLYFENMNVATYDLKQLLKQSEAINTDAAARSMVLLKNNGILPLAHGTRVRVCGPNASDSIGPLGNYNGTPQHTVTVTEALAEMTEGEATTIIYVGGLSPKLEGEELNVDEEGFWKGDRTRIELPRKQVEEIRQLSVQGHRIVLLLFTGSALALREVIDDVDAVVVCWYGGQEVGTAVREMLLGQRDAFGRLPVSFYAGTEQLPPFDDYAMQGHTYRYATNTPLFPFGWGLDFSAYTINTASERWVGDTLQVEVELTLQRTWAQTTSHRTVVQLFMTMPDEPEAPLRSLVTYAPVTFNTDERKKRVTLTVDPFWLRRYDERTDRMTAPDAATKMELIVTTGNGEARRLAVYTTEIK